MIFSQENLNTFIEKSKESNLKVIDGILIAHKQYKVDVLTYILNKYPKLIDIRFFWDSHKENVKGSILVIGPTLVTTIGFVTLKDNKIVISIDGFQFEDDSFNDYILKCKINDEHQCYIHNDLFGLVNVKSKTGGNIAVLNVTKGGNSLYFNINNYIETKNNITQLKIRECYGKNKYFEFHEMERLRINYLTKLQEIEKRLGVWSETFETSIDLKTGMFNFHSKLHIEKENERKFLEYIYSHYTSLNDPLYSSIIGNAEAFLSENYQTTVNLSDRDMIKRYLDLDSMITI